MRVYALHCGGDHARMSAFDPFDPDPGRLLYEPYFMFVITHPRGTVLFDSGAHPSIATDADARLGEVARSWAIELSAADSVEACLSRIGLTPPDITDVVQSHLHFDHAGGLESLVHAHIHVQRDELDFARNPPIYQRAGYVEADFNHDLDWWVADGDVDLFDDGTIRAIRTPGHTPGHQSLLVHLPGRTLFLLADAALSIEKMRARALPAFLWSPDAIIRSWERIEALERRYNARLIATHDPDFRTATRIAPAAYYD